jgi:hypothetical protein
MALIALFAIPLGLITSVVRARPYDWVLPILATTWLLPSTATLILFVEKREPGGDRPRKSLVSAPALLAALLLNLYLTIVLLQVLRGAEVAGKADFPTSVLFADAATTAMCWCGFGLALHVVNRGLRASKDPSGDGRHPLDDDVAPFLSPEARAEAFAAMERDSILREVEGLSTLAGVLRWATARTPRAEFVDVVIQDEYTHDVVIRVGAETFLVFDTT